MCQHNDKGKKGKKCILCKVDLAIDQCKKMVTTIKYREELNEPSKRKTSQIRRPNGDLPKALGGDPRGCQGSNK